MAPCKSSSDIFAQVEDVLIMYTGNMEDDIGLHKYSDIGGINV